MSALNILENATHAQIQAAQALALLRIKNGHKRKTLEQMGEVMGCCKQSVCQYISSDTEMSAPTWIKATAAWPELHDMMLAELDAAEKAAAALQRSFKLAGVE